jgi:putative RNA 2'-phosphotransferase
VHLSADAQTAANVGARHGTPVVLRIRAGGMAAAGHLFYRSENGVWLTDAVPPQFILFGDEQPSDQA